MGGNGAGYNTPAYTLTLAMNCKAESPPPAGFPSAGDGTQYGVGERISPITLIQSGGIEHKILNLFQSDDFTLESGHILARNPSTGCFILLPQI